ncbi:MAG: alpha/beta fold hydrolase [Actinobacteria bacterium]|nr:alpha/beta fold hydrolase [Actinomycetota bacterium]
MADTAAPNTGSPWEPPQPVVWRPLSGRLAAHVSGPDDGSRLVFLHGFTQTSTSWRPIAEEFARRGHECMVIDLPGHGDSANVRADLRRTADMVAAMGARATYVGYSLGGRAALHVALMYPDLVESLVTIGANPGIDSEDERARRRESDDQVIERMGEIGLEAFLREWVALPLFGGLAVSPADMDDRLRNTPEGLASSLRLAGTGAQGSLWPRLRELNMPVLAMAGERDEKFAAIARQIADMVPRGTCELVPDAAHAVHLQQPAVVVETLARWLAV